MSSDLAENWQDFSSLQMLRQDTFNFPYSYSLRSYGIFRELIFGFFFTKMAKSRAL